MTVGAGALLSAALLMTTAAPAMADPAIPGPLCSLIPATSLLPLDWSSLDGTGPSYVDEDGVSGLKFDNANGPIEYYRNVGAPLSGLKSSDLSYRFKMKTDGFETISLQVRATGMNTSATGNPSQFATIVWGPSPAIRDRVDADGWVTVTAADLADGRWWVTRDINGLGLRGAEATLAKIVELNPDATISAVGMTLARATDPSVVYVDQFAYKDCVSTFKGGNAVGSLDLGSLGS